MNKEEEKHEKKDDRIIRGRMDNRCWRCYSLLANTNQYQEKSLLEKAMMVMTASAFFLQQPHMLNGSDYCARDLDAGARRAVDRGSITASEQQLYQ